MSKRNNTARRAAIDQARALAVMDMEPYRLELMRRSHARRGGLYRFLVDMWSVLEPSNEFVPGWPIEAICLHLESVARGELTRLLITVPPGFSKSICTSVFLQAYIWGPLNEPHRRTLAFSYSQSLTERDGLRMRRLIVSPEYQALYGDRFQIENEQVILIRNDRSGFRLASSCGGVATGQRGDLVVIDDANRVDEAESERIRSETNRWYAESITSRFNSLDTGAMVVIQQRSHDLDLAGHILANEGQFWTHLCIPWEFDSNRQTDENGEKIKTSIGWSDPRTTDGEPAWEARFSAEAIERLKVSLGPYGWSGQWQQSPQPRGGGLIKRLDWRLWAPANNMYPKPLGTRVAAIDCATSLKNSADFSAYVSFAAFEDPDTHDPRLIMLDAWKRHVAIHGAETTRQPHEEWDPRDDRKVRRRKDQLYAARCGGQWGLVEWVVHSCRRFAIDYLIIENASVGQAVAQELRRLFRREGFQVVLLKPKGDKWSRAASVVPLFASGTIFAPNLDWAESVISECEAFPTGAHDDQVDAVVHVLQFMRQNNLIQLPQEARDERIEALTLRPKKLKSLYPI